MPSNSRDPGGSASTAAGYPVARAFALTVLAALVVLVILRHLFGSVSVSAGVR